MTFFKKHFNFLNLMSNPKLTRDELNELKALLAERIVDNMSTRDLVEYVQDDLFNYYDKQGEHEFLEEAREYWCDDEHFDEVINDVREIVVASNVLPLN